MERRRAGLLIVFLVVLTAAIVPTIGGRKIAGVAQSEPIPGPPAVGDCLQVREDRADSWNFNAEPVIRCNGSPRVGPAGSARWRR